MRARYVQGDLETRFWPKVKITDTCWIWTGSLTGSGYGQINGGSGRPLAAHRVAYEGAVGPIPGDKEIDHLCRNRACVRPDHLEVVTRWTNNARGNSPTARNLRKSHCLHGHPLLGDNVRIEKDGKRRCKTCARNWMREWHRAKRLHDSLTKREEEKP